MGIEPRLDLGERRLTHFSGWFSGSILTSSPLTVHALCLPAARACGDYGGVLHESSGDQVLVFLSDATGHGASAARIIEAMVETSERRGRLIEADTLSQLFDQMSAEMIANEVFESGTFITSVMLLVDLESRSGVITSAGHPAPVLIRDGVTEPLPIQGGIPLGLDDSIRATDFPMQFHSGDVLAFFTDGVADALHADGSRVGFSRVPELLAQAAAQEDPPRSLHRLLSEHNADEWQQDDTTAMFIKFG